MKTAALNRKQQVQSVGKRQVLKFDLNDPRDGFRLA